MAHRALGGGARAVRAAGPVGVVRARSSTRQTCCATSRSGRDPSRSARLRARARRPPAAAGRRSRPTARAGRSMRRPGPRRPSTSGGSSSASTRTGTTTTTSGRRARGANAHTSAGAVQRLVSEPGEPVESAPQGEQTRGDEELRREPRRAPRGPQLGRGAGCRSPQSTGRRLSGSTRTWSTARRPGTRRGSPASWHRSASATREDPVGRAAHLDEERDGTRPAKARRPRATRPASSRKRPAPTARSASTQAC